MFLLLVRRLDEQSRIWGEWQPHSAYPTEQAAEEVCWHDRLDGEEWKYIQLSEAFK